MVVAVGRIGLSLAVAEDGTWVVVRDGWPARPVTGMVMALLPLLERPYGQVTREVAARAPSGHPDPPWEDVLRLALTWRAAEYWPGLAVGWLEEGFPASSLLDELAALKDMPHRSQVLRHRALRIWIVARS